MRQFYNIYNTQMADVRKIHRIIHNNRNIIEHGIYKIGQCRIHNVCLLRR